MSTSDESEIEKMIACGRAWIDCVKLESGETEKCRRAQSEFSNAYQLASAIRNADLMHEAEKYLVKSKIWQAAVEYCKLYKMAYHVYPPWASSATESTVTSLFGFVCGVIDPNSFGLRFIDSDSDDDSSDKTQRSTGLRQETGMRNGNYYGLSEYCALLDAKGHNRDGSR